jgi:hypothetical protein
LPRCPQSKGDNARDGRISVEIVVEWDANQLQGSRLPISDSTLAAKPFALGPRHHEIANIVDEHNEAGSLPPLVSGTAPSLISGESARIDAVVMTASGTYANTMAVQHHLAKAKSPRIAHLALSYPGIVETLGAWPRQRQIRPR